ncbi:hypothetical protein JCM10450v2_002450 [Rhodotorula kratochvilovae]
MGLFSRKKQREPPPPAPAPPAPAARSTSAPAAATLASVGALSSSLGSSQGRSDPYGAGGDEIPSPDPASSANDRHRVFRGVHGAASSTLSLPSFGLGRDERAQPRQRQVSAYATPPVEEGDAAPAQDKGRWNRWKLGRGGKGRQASVSSMADASGLGLDGGADSGFVVRSFRTVSRVHEDPILAPVAQPVSNPAPLSSYAHSPSPVDPYDPPTQQESLRSSLDYGSRPSSAAYARHQPRRPSLATLGGGTTSSSHAWERAPSPTMTAEAFRFRSKSSLSLASLADSPASDAPQRPRFEPQRPASRASRRGSGFSDIGGSILAPPRPSFAVGHHSNGSSSSVNSRASSTASLGTYGANGLPSPGADAQAESAASSEARPGISHSGSKFSLSSYTTAQETRTTLSTPGPSSQVASAGAASPSTERPAMHRLSSGDSELRLIASYGDMLTSSPPVASPVELAPSSRPPFATPRKVSDGPGPSSRFSTLSTHPSVAVQPPTPQSAPGFSPPTSRRASTVPRPQRTSSLVNDSMKAALSSMGVGPPPARPKTKVGKGRAYPARSGGGWASDSSDEEERLSTSDEGSGSSDDEVPLAQIKSRSQTDLSLPPAVQSRASFDGSARTAPPPVQRRESSELEVLRDPHSPTAGSFGKAQAQAQLGVYPLARKGSNRRSVSTLSFSTSMTASQAATAAVAASSAGSSATTTAPSSPTRGILRPPYQARSVSNPSTPTIPAFQSTASASTSTATTPALSPIPSPLFPSTEARDRSSVSGSSGSASTSSVPLTPKDSPSASNLGLAHAPPQSLSAAQPKPSVKFDLAASQTDAAGWNRGRRLSAISSSAASAFGAAAGAGPGGSSLAHRQTPSMPHLGGAYAAPPRAGALGSRGWTLAPASHARTGSTVTPSAPAGAPHTRASSTASVSAVASSSSSTAVDDSVYDRMKARHKAEALQALQIGRDLNHPSGMVPDREAAGALGAGEDDDEPLANLPTKGSVLGGMGGGGGASMLGGMHPQMAMAMGDASLPPDQKMSLHNRAAQMMAMMQQAALQARAESVIAGSMIGGQGGSDHASSLRSSGGAGGGGHGASMSLGSLDAFGGGGGFAHSLGHGHAPSASMHLPPFAPSFAMSQPFFHPAQYAPVPPPGSFYGMPAYAGSAIGFPTAPMSTYGAPGSVMGVSPSPLPQGHRAGGARAASMMGTGARRPVPAHSEKAESPVSFSCGHSICGACVRKRRRLAQSCILCQTADDLLSGGSTPSSPSIKAASRAPSPPRYVEEKGDFVLGGDSDDEDGPLDAPPPPPDAPPAYEAGSAELDDADGKGAREQCALHHVRREDTLLGLSMHYGVDGHVLCTLNKLPLSTLSTTPHLLHTKPFLLLPPSAARPSASSSPLLPAPLERKRLVVRRFQVATKCADWAIAQAYVDQVWRAREDEARFVAANARARGEEVPEEGEVREGGELEEAVAAYEADERWEREQRNLKGKGPVGRRLGIAAPVEPPRKGWGWR